MSATQIAPGRVAPPGVDLRLPTPPGLVRRFWSRHPRCADGVLAGVYLALLPLVLLLDSTPVSAPAIATNVVVAVSMTVVLLFRRRFPRLVLALSWIGLLLGFAQYGQLHTVPVLIALYAVAVYRDARTAWIGLAASASVGALAAWLNAATYGSWVSTAIQLAIMMLAATLIGINVGNGKRYVVALLDLAEQLARERDQQAQLARVSERARIAREMHDVVAHSLSVMVALADGAHAMALKDPERSRSAMLEVAQTGRSSMQEMRRLLGVLAEDTETDVADGPIAPGATAPLVPQPGTDQLVELVESFRSANLPIRLEQNGRAPENAGMQLTIYRIVQESLTNVLRYSDSPSLVTVRVVSMPGTVEVVVTDNGPLHAPGPSQGSGLGIIGLQERVALYGGTVEAGPSAHRGWSVKAAMRFDPK